MLFTIENVKENTMYFLVVQIIDKSKEFTRPTHRKATLSRAYTIFGSFLQASDNFGTVRTLSLGCMRLCSRWTKLHTELLFLTQVLLKNHCPENCVNERFEKFMDTIHVVKETTLTVEKKPLVLVFPFLSSISLQARIKLKKVIKKHPVVHCK